MKRVSVLGAGLVGRVIAADLAAADGYQVIVWDRSADALAGLPAQGIEGQRADLSQSAEVARAVRDADVVALAVPGFLGAAALRSVIECGKPVVDISFSPEDPFALHDLARERKVTAVVDCGVAPGLSNLLAGRAAAELDELDEVVILVGGLPRRRVWPWEYRAVFSPTDVIEEYVRPCRFRWNGVEVVRPALTDPELVEFDEVGTLEAFNTDGLRTLLHTLPAKTLVEKTLRYPGHAEKMRVLREAGFFETTPVRIRGVEVSPRELTERLLFASWKLPEGEEDLTILRVQVRGSRRGAAVTTVWDLFDRTDPITRATSMARTTGFPCAIVARLIAEGAFAEPGVHAPETLGRDVEVTSRILKELGSRGVRIRRRDEGPRPGV